MRSLVAAGLLASVAVMPASADPGTAVPGQPGAGIAALGLAAVLLGNRAHPPVVHAAPAVIYPAAPVAGARPSTGVPRG